MRVYLVTCLLLSLSVPSSAGAQTTLRASLDAWPSWDGTANSPFPQIDNPSAVFHSLPSLSGNIDSGLLICRIEVLAGHPWDSHGLFGGHVEPDVTVSARATAEPAILLLGPEDQRSFFVSLAAITLRPNDRIVLTAVDRDIAADDHIGMVNLRYEGSTPMMVRSGTIEAECRVASHEEATRRSGAYIQLAERELYSLRGQLHPAITDTDFTFPEARVWAGRQNLRSAAALVGWADPAFQRAAELLADLRREWETEVSQTLLRLAVELPSPGESVAVSDGLRAQINDATCNLGRVRTFRPHAIGPCLAMVQIVVGEQVSLHGIDAAILDPVGTASVGTIIGTLEGDRVRSTAEGTDLPAGTHTLLIQFAGDLGLRSSLPTRPRLIRVMHEGQAVLLRVE